MRECACLRACTHAHTPPPPPHTHIFLMIPEWVGNCIAYFGPSLQNRSDSSQAIMIFIFRSMTIVVICTFWLLQCWAEVSRLLTCLNLTCMVAISVELWRWFKKSWSRIVVFNLHFCCHDSLQPFMVQKHMHKRACTMYCVHNHPQGDKILIHQIKLALYYEPDYVHRWSDKPNFRDK